MLSNVAQEAHRPNSCPPPLGSLARNLGMGTASSKSEQQRKRRAEQTAAVAKLQARADAEGEGVRKSPEKVQFDKLAPGTLSKIKKAKPDSQAGCCSRRCPAKNILPGQPGHVVCARRLAVQAMTVKVGSQTFTLGSSDLELGSDHESEPFLSAPPPRDGHDKLGPEESEYRLAAGQKTSPISGGTRLSAVVRVGQLSVSQIPQAAVGKIDEVLSPRGLPPLATVALPPLRPQSLPPLAVR